MITDAVDIVLREGVTKTFRNQTRLCKISGYLQLDMSIILVS